MRDPSSLRMLEPYPDPERRDAELVALVDAADGERRVYGHSVGGRDLWVARLPSRASRGARRLFCAANIHGIEVIANRVAHGLIRAWADPHGPAARLREQAELWVAPCVNPDGYARTFEQAGQGRVRDLRKNAHGVDLNRNFPLPPGVVPSRRPFGASAVPDAPTYRGPAVLSEPECATLVALLDEVRPHASVSLHSFMGALIAPCVRTRADVQGYRILHRAFAAAQPETPYRFLCSRWLDAFNGELEDHQHHAQHTWAVCIETFSVAASLRQHLRAPSGFWRFNPRDPEWWVRHDVPAVLAYFAAALELPPPAIAT